MDFKKMKKAELIQFIEEQTVPAERFLAVLNNYKVAEDKLNSLYQAKGIEKTRSYESLVKDLTWAKEQLAIEKAKQQSLELCFAVMLKRQVAPVTRISKAELSDAMRCTVKAKQVQDGFEISVGDKYEPELGRS